ncbi:MAG: BON domain-containing protein [Kangiellaceae bacterium]|jgi:osmotically-inducible protein OsmY|nr:BON domain-containing protein [Kangiellaceae bacterium]
MRSLIIILGLILVSSCASVGTGKKRSVEQLIKDENLEATALQNLFSDEDLWDNSSIEVISFHNTVLLVGQTPTKSLKDKAKQVLMKVEGVKRIHNEIRVSAPTSSLTYLSDVSITSKVKTSLFTEEDFDSSQIKVVTEDGEVFLLGSVNKATAKKAVEITRNVSGVKKVISVFEIVQE